MTLQAPQALASLQRDFQAYVLHRAPAVLAQVRASGKADAATRMDVYAEGYPLRLLEALQADYPGLYAIAGAQAFDGFGRGFIAAHPSRFRNLRWYGGALASYLATQPPWSARRELADMARFEWAMASSFDGADAEALQREALGAVDPEDWPRLRFCLHPAVRSVELASNVASSWTAQARGEPLPQTQVEEAPARWLLTRRELQVHFRRMAGDEALVFDQMASGASFEAWCSELGELLGEQAAAVRAVECLGQWLADGALAGFTLDPA